MPRAQVVDDPDMILNSMSGFRRTLLEMLDEPDSATGLARKLGVSRQKVNYHLRTLEENGFVELAELRQRRGLTERVVRRSADVVVVNPLAFDTTGLGATDAAGVSGVVTTATDMIRHAATVTRSAGADEQRVAAAALETTIRVASPGDVRRLLADLGNVIAGYDSETGMSIRIASLLLPEPPD